MFKKIKEFFREYFHGSVGTYDPKAEKPTWGLILYSVIGLILSFLIPACFVYIEVGQFNWNVFIFIWGKEAELLFGKGIFRGGYFLMLLMSIICFFVAGAMTTYRINGNKEMIYCKLGFQIASLCFFVVAVICYIAALIFY